MQRAESLIQALNTVRCLDDNIVFIDDRIIFSCNEIEIVRAVANPDVDSAFKKLWQKKKI